MLLTLDSDTFTHLAANFLALPAFAMLLHTSKRARRMLLAAFHIRRERMVAVARAVVPELGDEIYAVFRGPRSWNVKAVHTSKRGNVRCIMHMYIPDLRSVHGVSFQFTSSGATIKSESWSQDEPGNTAVKTHVAFIPETRLTGVYVYNEQSGPYEHGIIACLQALNLVHM
jgi:hypothetical protein